MLTDIKTWENGCSNLSENLTIVALKLLQLTILITKSIDFVIYFNFKQINNKSILFRNTNYMS